MKAFFEQKDVMRSWSRRATETMRGQYPSIITLINEIAWTVPEISYWSFSLYEIVIPVLLAHYRSIKIPIPIKLDFSWVLIDGIASIGIGLTQILDTQTHRPWCERTKGVINLSSGFQLILISILLLSAAPAAFITSTIVDFILSLETLLYTFRCRYSFSYWLQDKLAELRKRETEILAITEEMNKLEITLKEVSNRGSIFCKDLTWLIAQKQSQIENINSQAHQIRDQIIFRFAADTERVVSSHAVIDSNDFISLALKNTNNAIFAEAAVKEEEIRQHLFYEFLYAAIESFIFALIAAGWILFCLSAAKLPTAIFILVTASCYLLKHSVQIYRLICPQKVDESKQITYSESSSAFDTKENEKKLTL